MCGRTACTLAPRDMVDSCVHTNKKGKASKPSWKDAPGGRSYYPSYNVCPGAMTPILFATKHLEMLNLQTECESPEETDSEWTLMPMQWGLVPSWHTGDVRSQAYKMTNARSDGLLSKRSFKTPLEKGRRCVVVVDGYYEWQTGKDGSKQPYFLYQSTSGDVTSLATKCETGKSDQSLEDKRKERRLLMMAGLFDVWTSPGSGELLFSYSIITVDAHTEMSWLHHRMPAVLSGEDEVAAWLDFEDIALTSAVTSLIRPQSLLRHHAVSRGAVGNVHNKTEECVKPFDLEKERKKKAASSNFMQNWLKKAKSPEKKEVAEKRASSTDAHGSQVKDEAKKLKFDSPAKR